MLQRTYAKDKMTTNNDQGKLFWIIVLKGIVIKKRSVYGYCLSLLIDKV